MTGEILWESTIEEKTIDQACSSAKAASEDWANLPLNERITCVLAFQEQLRASKNTLAETISKETGKPLWESKSEVDGMIAKVSISIEAQQERCPERQKGRAITRHKPHGVAAVFGPFNFPGHLPNGHIVPAILAGNVVIFKPSELTPWVGEEVVKLWKRCLPESVMNLVQGGPEIGQNLSRHPDINAVLFTGSWKTGKILSEQFGSHPEKLLALEMGGNNPLVVWDISNMKAAAYLTIQSAYLTSGQRCTCARRLILPDTAWSDAFLDLLTEMISTIHAGPYTDLPEPFMGPVITLQAAHQLREVQKTLIDKGGRPLLKMEILQANTPLLSPGLIDVTAIPGRPDEEYFGPLLQVIRVADRESAIKEANRTSFGLAAAILTDSRDLYEEFYRRSRAGVVNWNQQTTGAGSAAPFGGVGHSGNHRPGAYYAADYCSFPVASLEAAELTLPETLLPGIGDDSSRI